MNSVSPQQTEPGTLGAHLPPHQGNLSLAFQEPLTVAARIRRNQFQAPDAGAFRTHLRNLLGQADAATRQAGYQADFAKLATYAVVALLDESILTSPGPLRGEWVGHPLQQELFGENVAGENFYLQLRDLLARPDTPELADILEVFLLCLLLGFKGRYAASDGAEVQGLITAANQKVSRIRGGAGPVAPQAHHPQGETPPRRLDPWIPRLLRGAVGAAVVALILFVGFRILLGSGASGVRDLAEQLIR